MVVAKFTRTFIVIVAGILFSSLVSTPLHAQDARQTNTDLKFHKFVPPTAPENNAAASSARQATTPDAVNAAATQQIELLLQEKSARTPVQQKIDSNVLYTIRMMRGEQAAPGFQSLYTGVELDDQNRIVVDIVADVSPDLLQKLQSAGALVLDSHPEYRSIRALVPPNQIELFAALPDVSFIGRKAEAITAGLKREPENYVMRRDFMASSEVVVADGARFAAAPRHSNEVVVADGARFAAAPRHSNFEKRAAKVRSQIAAYLQQQKAGANSTTGVINTGQGIVTTEGDATHLAARSRGVYGVNGAGLKIGVLSDSANNMLAATNAQATGDLPPSCPGPGGPCLTILEDFLTHPTSDEGTAMMEIIYDMAPGASLFFATANVSESDFASNILALRAAGCDIIVDDVFYFDEPVFQDGMIAQAVNNVTASGALYFSSAGNEGNLDAGTAGYFEGDFNDAGSPVFAGGSKSGTVHNFGSGLLGDPVTSFGEQFVLQWADPFNAPTDDYDLFYVNSVGAVLVSSTNLQNGTAGQTAIESFSPPVGGSLGDKLVVFKTSSAKPVLFALKTIRGTLTVVTAGETSGHSATVAAFSVAAAPAAANAGPGFPSGPFPNPFNRGSALEPFTSDGPRRIIFNPDGTPITPGNFSSTGGTLRNKPDLTAADGVSTTFASDTDLNPFFGTSAAAPHAAAIAALVKSAVPALTPGQIRTTLTTTALDLLPVGFDRDSGFGIVMADSSMDSLGIPGFANVTIISAIANENPGNGNGIIEPGEGGSLVIQLSNATGVKNATGITAVLSTTTPGVTITQPASSAYADIPVTFDGGNNLSPFTFTLASNAACALKINFTLTLTYTGGPAPTKALTFSIQTGAYSVTGNLGSSPHGLPPGVVFATGFETNRLPRRGVSSTCAVPQPFIGTESAGSVTFDSFTFTSTQSLCLPTVLTSPVGGSLFTAEYSPSFIPSSIGSGYLGDAGFSGSPQGFSINVTAANTYTIVVNDSSNFGTASGSPYTLQFPSCAITNPSSVNHPPIALAHDVTVTAPTPGATVAVSVDNGSSDPDAGDTITKTQTPPGPYSIGVTSVLLTVVDSKGATAQATANVTVLNPGPDLLITKSHSGKFLPGQVGATYTINVSSTGNAATSGTVSVVDTLPAALTATAMAGTGWSCTVATLTCTRADALALGASYPPITLTVNVSAVPPPTITNTATVSNASDVNSNNNIASDPTTIVVNPDLTVVGTHVGNFSQGQSNAVYTVTVTNNGSAPTTSTVFFLDTLPPGVSFVSIGPAPGWSCNTSGNETCERADPLAPNSSYPPVTIVVKVANNAPASGNNVVTVFGGGEANVSNDASTDPTTITPSPNLIIASAHTGNFSQGQTGASYSITATNIGFAATTGLVTVTDQLPQGFTATAMVGTGWTCTVATATCTRSDALAANSSYPVITLTGNVGAAAPLSAQNSVTVSGGGELFLADDSATDPTTINQSVDMTITLLHLGSFGQGEVGAFYTIIVTNAGFSSTTGPVTVQDQLPSIMTATAMSGTGWTCNVVTVTCTENDVLPSHGSYSIITLAVNVGSTNLPSVTNTATVSGGGETNLLNDTVSDPTTISSAPDMTLSMSHTGNFTPGQIGATYTIIASNSGPTATTGAPVSVVDNLPAGLTATGMAGTGWNCTAGTTACARIDVLASGASYPPITVTVNVSTSAAGTLINSATVTGGGEVINSNNTATDPTNIVTPADLTITKTHSGNFTQGQQGGFAGGPAYTITVSNSGSVPTTIATNVTVVDTLPPSLTAVTMLGTNWLCTLATLTCVEHDQLAPGASYPPITLSVLVGATAPASVTNTATVSGGGEVNTTNDTATDVTAITQLADLTIGAAIAPPGFFLKGQTGAQFAFNVTNSGAGPTNGTVTVVGTLPADLTPTAIAGTGWTCTLATLTCTRADALTAGQLYPSILVTMNVSATASATVSTTATVSGGGEIIVNNDVLTFNTQITSPPAVSLSVTALSFPNQGVNTTSASKQITVTNTGGQTLVFPGLFATVLSNSTNWTIAPGTTCANGVSVLGGGGICVINITFTPTAVGSVGPDTLTLNNNATPSHQDITLTGTGIDFATGGPVSPVSVTAGQTANFTITITPGAGGFANPVTFSATGLPSATSASFNPSSFTPGSTATSTTLSITTTARGMLPPSAKPNPQTPPHFVLWIVSLISILLTLLAARLVFTRKRQLRFAPAILIVTVLLTATIIAGCGGGGVTTPPPPTGTPAGTYPITVTSQSGTLVHTTAVTLTVQ